MGATTNEGTGNGSVSKLKPLIVNGVVEAENLGVDILHNWQYDINATGDMTTDSNVSADGDISSGNDISADGDISAGGNITADGFIRGSALGQHLNTSFWTFSSGNVTNNSGTYTNVASVSYTPVSASSHLLIEYHTPYTVSGSEADTWRSRITIGGSEITYRTQVWVATLGQDVRSSVLFPIAMKASNSVTTALTINISVARISGDDTLTVDTNNAFLKISEFAV